jgi:hypothetical protein
MHTAELTISASPGGIVTAVLFGETASEPPSLDPSSQNFGSVSIGATSASVAFTLRNSGSVASGIPSVSKGGPNPLDFLIMSDTCDGTPVPGGGACTVEVAFSPTTLGARIADLRVSIPGAGTAIATLSGTGATTSGLVITPSVASFGTVAVAMSSAPIEFTVTNLGSTTSGSLAIALGGPNPADFIIVTNGCFAALAPGASCTLSIAFAPTTTGARNADIRVQGSPGGTATASISGTGT